MKSLLLACCLALVSLASVGCNPSDEADGTYNESTSGESDGASSETTTPPAHSPGGSTVQPSSIATQYEPAEITTPVPDDVPAYPGATQIRGETSEDGNFVGVWYVENVEERTVFDFFESFESDATGNRIGALYENGWSLNGMSYNHRRTSTISESKDGRTILVEIEPDPQNRVYIKVEISG